MHKCSSCRIASTPSPIVYKFQPWQATPIVMDESLCSGHNKPYNPNEVQLLIALKSSGMPWRLIELEYNRQVPADRQRTASALENKWRQLLSIQIHVPQQ
ncbi:hypothetical protein BJX76DRAFT_331347 [Aspergillus varians]|uniref:Myb-like domain-containing protein n=1 Tax=Aspergillus sydowii CBS 593.65 TaxID=1036612 RepID=A0A1L9TTB2_9EURO|nr:uncharacterized protein ASPSYDRAFT_41356 [Aspergillus sydowii CBS 593.65]OJJ62690.1 hypothetical protein ASPSYDRAFT_41356 [Aspergillus sydowii CBS 593.65]